MSHPELPESAHVWELRTAWAKRRAVRLTLSEACVIRTVVGTVESIAATGAYVMIDGWHIPTYTILSVGKPTPDDRARYRKLRREALSVLNDV